MKHTLSFLLPLLLCPCVFAQKESNFWFFAGGALSFTSGSPVSIPGFLSTDEGTTAMSDPVTGNLLFYSNGVVVNNATGGMMPNGGGLTGDISSSQAALAVPLPGSSTIYYLFTADNLEDNGVKGYRYNIIDMSLAGGLGDIVAGSKNILLYDTCSEQLSAVKHANCIDWWIMTKEFNNDRYAAYLLTSAGLSGPVISSVGIPSGFSSFGQAKFSPDGSRYAITNGQFTQLFDFDNATGLLSNPLVLSGGSTGPGYGVSFSADNSKLYTCRGTAASQICQFDLSSGVPATILASATIVGNCGPYNQMQLGKNHKIYVSHDGFNNLSVINNPNLAGTACNFVLGALPIAGMSKKSICNFPDSYFDAVTPCILGLTAFAHGKDISCHGNTDGMAWVTVVNSIGPYTVSWSPGGYTTDTLLNLLPGTYVVTVTDSLGTVSVDSVVIAEPAVLQAGFSASADTLCAGTTLLLDAGSLTTGGTTPYHFQWSTGPGDSSATLSTTLSSSTYISLQVTDDNGCTDSDSLLVTIIPYIPMVLPPDTCICLGGSITLTASGPAGFHWNTGDTTASITVTPVVSGWYEAGWDNGFCATSDSVFVCVSPLPVIDGIQVYGDSICGSGTAAIDADITGGSFPYDYSWSAVPATNSDSIVFSPGSTTTVNLVVTDAAQCTADTSVTVTVFAAAWVNAPASTCLCSGESVALTATGNGSFLWNNGEGTATVSLSPASDTTLYVTASLGPCSAIDSVFVCVYPLPEVHAYGDTSVEYNNPVELLVTGNGPFTWSPADGLSCTNCDNPVALPQQPVTYTVTATSSFGCSASDTVHVDVFYVVRIPNIITPNGDGQNDVFRITGLPPQSALSIFNRWGNEVYVTGNYENNWSAGSDGVYYYVLETPDTKKFSGFVQVTGNP